MYEAASSACPANPAPFEFPITPPNAQPQLELLNPYEIAISPQNPPAFCPTTLRLDFATMTKSDLDMLLEMGFEQARAELAVKKTGGCQYSVPQLSLVFFQA
jgi:hypothetical protein